LVLTVTPVEGPTLTRAFALGGDDSMATFALNEGSPILTSRLATEKRFTDLLLRKAGAASAMTAPLYLGDKPFGTLGVYTNHPRDFLDEDAGFLETIAHLLSSSIARMKAEEQLRRQNLLSTTVLDMVEAPVLMLDVDGNLLSMNRAGQRVTQFSMNEIQGKPFWNVFVVPGEMERIRGIFREVTRQTAPLRFEGTLLAKDGTQRHVVWTVQVIREGKEALSIVLTGLDKTEQTELETELREERALAKKATKAWQAGKGETDGEPPREENAPAVESMPFQPQPATSGFELRSSPRRAYRYSQLIAPVYHGQIPTPKSFFPVECIDISAGGLSFYFEEKPPFEDLVVALGKPPALTYFAARVVRVAETEQDGKPSYLVGCRFSGRVHL